MATTIRLKRKTFGLGMTALKTAGVLGATGAVAVPVVGAAKFAKETKTALKGEMGDENV